MAWRGGTRRGYHPRRRFMNRISHGVARRPEVALVAMELFLRSALPGVKYVIKLERIVPAGQWSDIHTTFLDGERLASIEMPVRALISLCRTSTANGRSRPRMLPLHIPVEDSHEFDP
jgi:hypothetical protein